MTNEELSLEDCADVLISRVKKDFDAVVCISGDEGVGKSILALQLIRFICLKLKYPFDLDLNVIYNPDAQQVWDKVLHTTPRYSPILLDEAITLLYKQDFAGKAQKVINKLYSVCRKENKITVLCIPNFFDLNTFFRNRRVIIWIEVIGRGRAVVFLRDWSPFNPDRWHTKESQKIIEQYTRRKTNLRMQSDDKISVLRRLRNYVSNFEFDDLDLHTKREYKKRSEAIKYSLNFDDTPTGLSKKYRDAANSSIVALYGMGKTQAEIEVITGFSIAKVNHALRDAGVRKSDKMTAGVSKVVKPIKDKPGQSQMPVQQLP